ncbi:MAG: hypothetical protein LBT04_00010 [Prevotellaceae bacterium]|nr:hypothetical protein [Prevotellaceae bacterium]
MVVGIWEFGSRPNFCESATFAKPLERYTQPKGQCKHDGTQQQSTKQPTAGIY